MESVGCASQAVMGPACQTIAGCRMPGRGIVSRQGSVRGLGGPSRSTCHDKVIAIAIASARRGVAAPSACCARAGLRLPRLSVKLQAGSRICRVASDFRRQISLSGHRSKPIQRRGAVQMAVGEMPTYDDDDYVVVGLAHCFTKDESGKLEDAFVIEPIPAGGLECMENGGVTCYKYVTATRMGKILSQDKSVLPEEFRSGRFSESFDFRAKCAARTWKRQHPQENLLHLVEEGSVRSDFNFSLEVKRVLNEEVVVNDDDNIKQDLSIDVYGRAKDKNEMKEIDKLYNA
ncbi:hypothetical protein CBR_g21853 [Chara braunii]|uniref:Uncharacterized protein n=1 Tax=Chara braunii TaxID=69332 RepID=A0A388JUN1_CHABU|nr:hypothetical protein CBR_g21853 [Chara braunii]|eukprot:GBG61511.1 hypothetical protein CBR_g21853 [Chara braunii]